VSTRLVIIDYVVPTYDAKGGDICTSCPRRKVDTCQHFGKLALKPKTKRTYLRHPKCIRAEERTRHSSISSLMQKSDFLREVLSFRRPSSL
jgi:hypothetical protein